MPPLFPRAWFASGVVTGESAADFARFAAAHPERPARHWRWAAFRDWCEERERLTGDECRAAYALGEAEPDANLGTAVMCRALYERTCPADVRDAAERSDRAPVRRAAGETRGFNPWSAGLNYRRNFWVPKVPCTGL